ncbi:MAG: tryptophan--tRNA ligase [Candidatus Omnitrophica bacterium]|nr:tryptophan--tRNA ligase [Candidatus Omnitrophota bacterium]
MKKRILSGMRPTGPLHLGHLFGTLKNWVSLQDDYDCLFMVADWHALMSEYEDLAELKKNIYEMVKDWIACGINVKKCVIFLQSAVPYHLELAMVFSVITPLAWLERCPTYKEQLRELKGKDITTYGFLGYPVLQAADITIYKAHKVPVGMDQLPHLELTREIVRRFHFLYKKEIFPEPEPLLTNVPKLLGLDNRKMSKSFGNYIAISDAADAVRKKISQMITDPKRIKLSDKGHPDVCNIFSYYGVFADKEIVDNTRDSCVNAIKGCTECKKNLAEIIIEYLRPIQLERVKLKNSDIDELLKKGNKKAAGIAEETMDKVREVIGLYR